MGSIAGSKAVALDAQAEPDAFWQALLEEMERQPIASLAGQDEDGPPKCDDVACCPGRGGS